MMSITKITRVALLTLHNISEFSPSFIAPKNTTSLSLASFHTTTLNSRWHKDTVENRDLYRHGYIDRVKQSGALPRISEDSPRIKEMKVFRPSNPFAPKEALFGQNDYIDILGKYMIRIQTFSPGHDTPFRSPAQV